MQILAGHLEIIPPYLWVGWVLEKVCNHSVLLHVDSTVGKYMSCFFPGIHSSKDTLSKKCSLNKQETTRGLYYFIIRMSTGRQTGADKLWEERLACVPFHLFRHLNFIYGVMRHCFPQWLAVERPQKYSGLLLLDRAIHGGKHMGSLILLGFIHLSSSWKLF